MNRVKCKGNLPFNRKSKDLHQDKSENRKLEKDTTANRFERFLCEQNVGNCNKHRELL